MSGLNLSAMNMKISYKDERVEQSARLFYMSLDHIKSQFSDFFWYNGPYENSIWNLWGTSPQNT